LSWLVQRDVDEGRRLNFSAGKTTPPTPDGGAARRITNTVAGGDMARGITGSFILAHG
jgi:hypothetical protein